MSIARTPPRAHLAFPDDAPRRGDGAPADDAAVGPADPAPAATRGMSAARRDAAARLAAALAGRYRVEREIGAGGMATVHLALDLRHRRRVAIKVLRPELSRSLGTDRFLREVEIAASLHHPHIVPLFDSGQAEGLLFYVMPFVEGESLRERLRRVRRLPLAEAVTITRDVASALAHAHASGVVHRDVKPENILLMHGHALVTDFGIARAIGGTEDGRITDSSLFVGTPAYMSPEQAEGDGTIDARTDVYALGCVLHEMLAGEPPFTGPMAQVVFAKHRSHPVPRITRLRDDVPARVEEVLLRALAKSRDDRFATVTELAESLAPRLTRTPVTPAQPVPATRTARLAAIAARTIPRRAAWLALPLSLLFLGLALDTFGVRSALFARDGRTRIPAPAARQSVAVLPFETAGDAAADDYIGDGLTTELIASLSRVRSLRVAARGSSLALRGAARDVPTVARLLGVATVLDGRVERSGEGIRVSARLIDAATGEVLWSARYDDRAREDIPAIQADMAVRIARALESNLTPVERGRLERRPTGDIEAYTLYLKGRFAWSQRGEGLLTAIDYFDRAIALDSQYARAWAGLASAYAPLGVHGQIDPAVSRTRTREAAHRALALDDGLAEAHMALAAYLHVHEWDWRSAEQTYRRAIALDPNDPAPHDWYGFLLEGLGRFDEAVAERRRGHALDPLAPGVGLPAALALAGRDDEARAEFEAVLARHPNYWLAWDGLGRLLATRGEWAAAIRAHEQAVERGGSSPVPRAGLARTLAQAGRRAEARRIVDVLRAEAEASGVHHPAIATALSAIGDMADAVQWMEVSYAQRHPFLVRIAVDPRFEELRREPRVREMMREMGLGS